MTDHSACPRAVRVAVASGALLIALAACGVSPTTQPAQPASGSSAATAGASGGPSPSAVTSPTAADAPADAGAAFCAQLKANGASGSDFGAIPTFYPKDELLADVQGKLKAMGDATPPAEIAEPWALQKRALTRVEAKAKKLPANGRLVGDPAGTDEKLATAEDTITDYWFAHCRG